MIKALVKKSSGNDVSGAEFGEYTIEHRAFWSAPIEQKKIKAQFVSFESHEAMFDWIKSNHPCIVGAAPEESGGDIQIEIYDDYIE